MSLLKKIALQLAKESLKEKKEHAIILRKANGYRIVGKYEGGENIVYIPKIPKKWKTIVIHTHFHTLKPSRADLETKRLLDIEKLCIVLAKDGIKIKCY